ncbi:hypothetical protein TREMEDRAFT_57962 [Tremella mesenterica DSM 1558]|uniref:uncharacterized protein n=1 Tax=Tremella mesenterica (strain ATCC 24925 / CBS 8224 / DSM 1558 / NBRC 9311 / NRRL Y-6157 / RJB 2259-6 / UBC 559-6) TaxID=578456 RepID=UPI00032C15AC|nr:uncharacterized protein TREMEDRAFT_57962 [Tremella mesenterica DSM 1558]EIW65701.1 hypothetical protein TREMEDRAFT_57962 [Tremella mesenterica DSM 1558]
MDEFLLTRLADTEGDVEMGMEMRMTSSVPCRPASASTSPDEDEDEDRRSDPSRYPLQRMSYQK